MDVLIPAGTFEGRQAVFVLVTDLGRHFTITVL